MGDDNYLLDDNNRKGNSVVYDVKEDSIVVQVEGIHIIEVKDEYVLFNKSVKYSYKLIVDPITRYEIEFGDYFVEIQSASCAEVTLPAAADFTGIQFIVSRHINNPSSFVLSSSENIDAEPYITFYRAGQHVTVISNGHTWFVL
jgi:hypothetical protein